MSLLIVSLPESVRRLQDPVRLSKVVIKTLKQKARTAQERMDFEHQDLYSISKVGERCEIDDDENLTVLLWCDVPYPDDSANQRL